MSLELLKSQQVHWIQCQFNFDVICHLFAYYPHLMIAPAEQSTVNEAADADREEKERLEQELIRALNAIYQLSIFMHFNGCHQIMIDYSKHIDR